MRGARLAHNLCATQWTQIGQTWDFTQSFLTCKVHRVCSRIESSIPSFRVHLLLEFFGDDILRGRFALLRPEASSRSPCVGTRPPCCLPPELFARIRAIP